MEAIGIRTCGRLEVLKIKNVSLSGPGKDQLRIRSAGIGESNSLTRAYEEGTFPMNLSYPSLWHILTTLRISSGVPRMDRIGYNQSKSRFISIGYDP